MEAARRQPSIAHEPGALQPRRPQWLMQKMLERRDWIEWMLGKWRDQKAFRMLLNEHPEIVNKVFVVDPPGKHDVGPTKTSA